jgi:protoheme IX farnesyltransferase
LPVPASIALATWGLYVLLYTPLKSISSINTLIGTLPGALPVLIGWTAGGGSLNEPLGWWMTAVLVLWQLPHFMAIAWLYREQYQAAGFQMLTTVDPTGRLAAWHALLPALAIFPVGVLSVGADGLLGWILGIASVLANLGMAWGAFQFWKQQTSNTARYLLRASLIYLPAMLLVWVLRVCL